MKRVETEYDNYGWKLIVSRNKEGITQIYLRSKIKAHQAHKPFYLRLTRENLKKLKILLNELDE